LLFVRVDTIKPYDGRTSTRDRLDVCELRSTRVVYGAQRNKIKMRGRRSSCPAVTGTDGKRNRVTTTSAKRPRRSTFTARRRDEPSGPRARVFGPERVVCAGFHCAVVDNWNNRRFPFRGVVRTLVVLRACPPHRILLILYYIYDDDCRTEP